MPYGAEWDNEIEILNEAAQTTILSVVSANIGLSFFTGKFFGFF